MVDVVRVAMIHSIDDLEEDGFDTGRIPSVCEVVVDQVVEATPGAAIEERGGVVIELDILVQGNDIGVFGEEVVDSALLFPAGRLVHDFQRQLTRAIAIDDTEDSAEAAVSEKLLDVEFIVDSSPQQPRFEMVDVRGDEHGFLPRGCGDDFVIGGGAIV
jgi:hypothetical protein